MLWPTKLSRQIVTRLFY